MNEKYFNRYPSGRPIQSQQTRPHEVPRYLHPDDRYAINELELPANNRNAAKEIPVELGMVLEDVASGYVGEVMQIGRVAGQWQMQLADAHDRLRSFPLGPGFWRSGKPVVLLPPQKQQVPAQTTTPRTASGSVKVSHTARVAIPSRIWVEGKHDAELISKIWGADLAHEGIMIEELFGADKLLEVLQVFSPNTDKRAGVLLDHLVIGTKESKIAAQAEKLFSGVRVVGHPYVDIWQAVKPASVGISSWPDVPRGEDIKIGTLKRLGWPAQTAEDVGLGWKRILNSVNFYTDLEPAFLGRVEELIDFVTGN